MYFIVCISQPITFTGAWLCGCWGVTRFDSNEMMTISTNLLLLLEIFQFTETNQQMNSIAFKFSKVLYGGSGSQPRWRGCVSKVSNALGYAVGAAYIGVAFDGKAKSEVRIANPNLFIDILLFTEYSYWIVR